MSDTKCEFCGGSYEAAGVGCCLLGNAHRDITRLRAENERSAQECATLLSEVGSLCTVIGEIQEELSFDQEHKSCSNGSSDIVAAIQKLKRSANSSGLLEFVSRKIRDSVAFIKDGQPHMAAAKLLSALATVSDSGASIDSQHDTCADRQETIAALRAENERNELANEHLREGMANLAAKVVDLESQLTALRRPVGQSEAIETYMTVRERGPLGDRWFVLDSHGEKIELEEGEEYCCISALSALDQAQLEIARLSSPPPDRAAIAARIADFRTSIADWGNLSETESAAAASDIEALLQDSARYRNALKVSQETIALVTRERDEARKTCAEWLQQNAPGGWIDGLRQRVEGLEHELRKSKPIPVTERLPTHIYSVFIFVLDDLHDDHWDIGIYNAQRGKWQCNDGDRDRDVAISHWIDQPDDPRISLAAADGQEPAPEQSLIETTRRSPRVVDAGNLRDAADGQRDLLTANQVLLTLTPEQRAATEALRRQVFGDGVEDGRQNAVDPMDGKHECRQCGLKFSTLAHWSFHEEQCDELRPDQQPSATGDGVEGE